MPKDTLYFALCPHIKEKELIFWHDIASKISSLLNKEIKLVSFEDFESENIDSSEYDIYYANPETALKLIKKGYILLAKIKNENANLCSIVSEKSPFENQTIRVALVNQKYFMLPLLLYKKEYKKFQLIFVKSYEDVFTLIRENKADIGFVYTQHIKKSEEYKGIKFSDDFCFPISHFILIHPSLTNFKEVLLSLEVFEKVYEQEIESLQALYNQLDTLLQDWAYHDISEALIKSPNLGVIIYHEKILFFNEYAKNLLGYSDEQLYNMSVIDLVYAEDKEKVLESYNRRLKGEKFSMMYDIRFQKKDGSVIFFECFTNTILFRGLYSGFIVFYDITSKKLSEKFQEILIQLNKIITQSLTEEEIYNGICKSLIEKLGLKFVWIGVINERENKIIPAFYKGEDEGIFQIPNYTLIEENSIVKKAVTTGNLVIKPDIKVCSRKVSFVNELLKRGFMSLCVIPLFKNKKIVSLIKAYSQFSNFFNENVLNILREIQYDISFALERVEKLREDIIISEALKNSDTWILVTDEQGNILYVNEAVEKISGYTKEELIGQNPRIFKSGLNPPEFYKEMWDTVISGKIFNAITPNRKKDGEIFHADLKIIPVRLPGDILRFVAVAKDVTEKIRLSERIQRLQNYDALTGLLNLSGYSVNISRKLRESSGLGMFVLADIYDMTYINKIYGIQVGDDILRFFAQNLKKAFDNTEEIARIGADTFGVYYQAESIDDIYRVYSKLYDLSKNLVFPIDKKTIPIYINASVAIFPKDGEDFKSLYERADITLQKAKKSGAGVIQFFDTEIEKEAEKLWEVFDKVKEAVEKSLFIFYYQPYYHTDSVKLAGLEALVRILDKENRVYSPNFFIDYLENSQYLSIFENWAIDEISDKIKKWNINISLNISGKTFSNPFFLGIISKISPQIRHKLTIEITERVLIKSPEFAMNTLLSIKKISNPPSIAMDDFGTGFSSLVYLKDLPVDIIKIDRAFIRDMIEDKKSLAIVQTIIDLAKRLERKTLAEGVETEQQFEMLRTMKCDYVQGFLFSKPLPESEIEKFLSK